MTAATPHRSFRWLPLIGLVTILVGTATVLVCLVRTAPFSRSEEGSQSVAEATEAEVRQLCAACHAYPPPDALPRSAWMKEVSLGFRFAYEADMTRSGVPNPLGVLKYYEARAPESLTLDPPPELATALPVRFDRSTLPLPSEEQRAVVSCVKLVALTRDQPSELLACDARTHQILLADLTQTKPVWKVLATGQHPARVEVVDLDGDGIRDILVANLGEYYPSDGHKGSVVWLRGRPDGSFTPITLLEGVGRVADVKVADFDGDGKLDVAVAVFGWRATGELLLLENRTTDWKNPNFVTKVLDKRHGATELAIGDLNGDGRPDIVCLFSQEHESVVALLNDGRNGFKTETIYQAPHPIYGCCGIELVDLDGDGDLDVLLVNGDVLDQPVLKPYHGVQWLENKGRYPFTHHAIGQLCGVMSARTLDFNGDGKLDIAAVCYLPARDFPQREERRMPAVVLYEQVERGQFRPLVLEVGRCDNLSCAVGRLPGDTLPSLIAGHGDFVKEAGRLDAVTIWRNRGRP